MNKKERKILKQASDKLYNLYWYGGDVRIMRDISLVMDCLVAGVSVKKELLEKEY